MRFFKKILGHADAVSEAQVKQHLTQLRDPNTGQDYVSAKTSTVRRIAIDGTKLQVDIVLGYPARSQYAALEQQIGDFLLQLEGVSDVDVTVSSDIVSHCATQGVALLPGVKNIIAVASGKGGVGKSTTAANVALALAAEGARVGLLDADIYGPSQPLIMGVAERRPETADGKILLPITQYDVQIMSIGFLVDSDQAMVWRGPMVSQALMQLLNDTRWDALDYLVVDMPPGTGDVQLTLAQKVPVTGALIVTTPQDIALIDARKAIKMFEKVNVPVLGIVENMALHLCSNCGHSEAIFGSGGGEKIAAQYGVELVGQLPLDISIRATSDAGKPSVVDAPESAIAASYRQIARRIAVQIAERSRDFSARMPKIVIQQNT